MISPLQLSRAIRQALDYRTAGMSQMEAVVQACRTTEISCDWAMIIHLALDGSSSLALAWCEEMTMKELDHAKINESSFR